MTAKRFTLDNALVIYDNDKKPLSAKNTVDLLNNLHEENEFLKIKNEKTQISIRQKDKQITDLIIKKEDTEYELLHLKEMYEELLMEKQEWKTK